VPGWEDARWPQGWKLRLFLGAFQVAEGFVFLRTKIRLAYFRFVFVKTKQNKTKIPKLYMLSRTSMRFFFQPLLENPIFSPSLFVSLKGPFSATLSCLSVTINPIVCVCVFIFVCHPY
jgi:hypothetical protein